MQLLLSLFYSKKSRFKRIKELVKNQEIKERGFELRADARSICGPCYKACFPKWTMTGNKMIMGTLKSDIK